MSPSASPSASPLRACLIDMNNGQENQGVRCLRGLIDQLFQRARAANPGLSCQLVGVEPRNLGEQAPSDCDLYISSGGPGSPRDGYDDPWCRSYRKLIDGLVDEAAALGDACRSLFLVCHSFEIAVVHLGIASMRKRPNRKFGVMPVYTTSVGMASPLLAPFGDRLFAFEHRMWEVIDLDVTRLAKLGGELWARESRDGYSKGESLLAFRFAPNIEGTLFHPEADRPGAVVWLHKQEHAAALVEAYGEALYLRMLKTLDDPMRLARTYALLIPGWLSRRFNALAGARGWNPVPPPVYDEASMAAFGTTPEAAREAAAVGAEGDAV